MIYQSKVKFIKIKIQNSHGIIEYKIKNHKI